MKTGIVRDRRYLEHEMGSYHPESPRRLEAVYRMLDEDSSPAYLIVEPRAASEEEVTLVHTPSYFRQIRETSGKERAYLDPDTSTCPQSFEVARLAAGGLLKAADLIMEGEIQPATERELAPVLRVQEKYWGRF